MNPKGSDADNNDPGIHVIHKPDRVNVLSFDVIAIHNSGGHYRNTWTDEQQGYFWLGDSASTDKGLPNCRIISYQCPELTPKLNGSVTRKVLWDIIQDRQKASRTEAPIILLAADDGGALVKHLYLMSKSPPDTEDTVVVKKLHDCIKGFAFFGGYHRFTEDDAGDPVVKSWWYDYAFQNSLEVLNKDFDSVCYFRKDKIPWVCFYKDDETADRLMHLREDEPKYENATPSSKNVPIGNHPSQLTKFASAGSPDLAIVLENFGELKSAASKLYGLPGRHPGGLRLLSLDGGGVRGLFSVMILSKILAELDRIENLGSKSKPCEVFDLVGGTSTGGLLAIMLSRLEMDTKSCEDTYGVLSNKIFNRGKPWFKWTGAVSKVWDAYWGKPWFSGDTLRESMEGVMEKWKPKSSKSFTSVAEAELLYDESVAPGTDDSKLRSKCFVCAIRDDDHECIRLRSYPIASMKTSPQVDSKYPAKCKIWEAGRATSSAPLYFPPTQIGDMRFFDGGMQSNNPILEVVDEAFKIYGPNAIIQSIVSIGTGESKGPAPTGGLANIIGSFVSRATNTEGKHREFLNQRESLKESYFRFQGSSKLGAIDLAAVDEMGEIKKLADDYAESPEGKKMIEDCAKKLCRV